MIYSDTHTQSVFSFDGHNTPEEMCAAAAAAGLSAIAITDHYDADGITEGVYDPYDAAGAKEAILRAREKHAPGLRVAYGVELGQPYVYPAESGKFIRECGFDFIICSLHNLVSVPDFSFLDYSKMPQALIERLWERALDEIYNLLLDYRLCPIHALGHLTYPVRYIKRAGRGFDMTRYYDRITHIFRKLKERGIALEVNTSGLRQGAGMTLPDAGLLRLYRDCGGELITVGSDAHYAADIGADIADTYGMLAALGFRYTTFFMEGKPEFIKISD
jgi:histidinol-phosphatase (PHP family)